MEFSPQTSSYWIWGGDRESLLDFRADVCNPGAPAKAEVNSPRSPGKSASTPGRATEPAPGADSRAGWGSRVAGVPAGRRCELPGRAPSASRAAQAGPKVGHLPGRKLGVQTHVGGAPTPGRCRAGGCGKRREGGWSSDLAFPSGGEGVDGTSQVCGAGSVTQSTADPTLWAARVPSLWTETRGAAKPRGLMHLSAAGRREARTRRGRSERARLGAAPERAGQQWALAILLCPTRSPSGPGLLRPLLLLLLLLPLLPSAGLIAEPPACKVPGAPAATSRRLCWISVGACAPASSACPEASPSLPARSAGRRCSAALPMAQPESRLRAPDRLDRGAAQVSAARLWRGPPRLGSGKTWGRRGALTGVPD